MSDFEKTLEKEYRRRVNANEGRELGMEATKEDKEKEELKKAAARERAEKTSREIKSTQKQMQNIVANMQLVLKAVQAIRQQLDLTEPDENIPSVSEDRRTLENLQKKLANLSSQLDDLRKALLEEEQQTLRAKHSNWSVEQIDKEAESRVQEILKKLGLT